MKTDVHFNLKTTQCSAAGHPKENFFPRRFPCPDKCSRKMSMGYWWNDIDRGHPKYSEKNLSQCQFVHHRSYMDRPGVETGSSK